MKTITILIPYFGTFPEWFPLFFETMKRNPTITFILYTDCDFSGYENIPNVVFKKTGFQEYVEKVREKIHVDFRPANAYKLCDLRPLLADIHYDDIQDADFYGWADIDLLFGNIRSFYTDEILSAYDVLSTHEIRISGHLALFRNIPRNRNMYNKIYNWRTKLEHPYFVGIDEHGITNAYLMTVFDKFNEKFHTHIENGITRYFKKKRKKKLYLKEQYTTPFTDIPWIDGTVNSDHPDTWFYRDGVITNSRDGERKFIYIHFMNFKSGRYRHDGSKAPWEGKETICFAAPEDMRAGIRIDNRGIFPENKDIPDDRK